MGGGRSGEGREKDMEIKEGREVRDGKRRKERRVEKGTEGKRADGHGGK